MKCCRRTRERCKCFINNLHCTDLGFGHVHGTMWQLQNCTEQAETKPRQVRNQSCLRQNAAREMALLCRRSWGLGGRHLQMDFSYWLEKQCGLWPAPNQPSIRATEDSTDSTYVFSKSDFFFQPVVLKARCPPQFYFHLLQWKVMIYSCDVESRQPRTQLFHYQVFSACPSFSVLTSASHDDL